MGIDLLGRICDALDVTLQEFFSDKRLRRQGRVVGLWQG